MSSSRVFRESKKVKETLTSPLQHLTISDSIAASSLPSSLGVDAIGNGSSGDMGIWVYLPEQARPPTRRYYCTVIRRHHYSRMLPLLALGGEEFRADFLKITKGWHPVEWQGSDYAEKDQIYALLCGFVIGSTPFILERIRPTFVGMLTLSILLLSVIDQTTFRCVLRLGNWPGQNRGIRGA